MGFLDAFKGHLPANTANASNVAPPTTTKSLSDEEQSIGMAAVAMDLKSEIQLILKV
jgi:hypothetical protein